MKWHYFKIVSLLFWSHPKINTKFTPKGGFFFFFFSIFLFLGINCGFLQYWTQLVKFTLWEVAVSPRPSVCGRLIHQRLKCEAWKTSDLPYIWRRIHFWTVSFMSTFHCFPLSLLLFTVFNFTVPPLNGHTSPRLFNGAKSLDLFEPLFFICKMGILRQSLCISVLLRWSNTATSWMYIEKH